MAIEKTIRDHHEHARMQIEGLLGIRPPKSPAMYRKEIKDDPETMPVLYCGQRVVVRVSSGGYGHTNRVVGYLLCRVMSWSEQDPRYSRFWSLRTCVYLVPEKASTPALDDRVGQLMHAYATRETCWWVRGAMEITSFDAADMPKRIEAAA